MLNPAILLSSARTVPRCFLLKAKYCCSVNVAFIHAYLSARLWPVNSISALPLRNPRIPSGVSVCTFSIRISIHLVAWQTHNFTIILYWKQAPFQDHLVLDNSAGSPLHINGKLCGSHQTPKWESSDSTEDKNAEHEKRVGRNVFRRAAAAGGDRL